MTVSAPDQSEPMNVIYFLLIGLCAGWIAGHVTRGGGFGIIGNLIFGMIGSVVGGYLFHLFGAVPESLIMELIAATVGAIVLLIAFSLLDRLQARHAARR
ncbi:MAG: GlsB/YeaQ/YmgE family stress response membrane protein [Phycisphaeraceae bacterium]|nr:GlsB/YeaQ/YmgE family stress response membrane protein [Phycisphaeraceae bacterium]